MSCEQIEELLGTSRDALHSDAAAEEHVRTCEHCRELVREHDLVCEALAPIGSLRPGASPAKPKPHSWEMIAMAASLLVCLWILVAPNFKPPTPAHPTQDAKPAKERFVCVDDAGHKSLSIQNDRAEVDGVELRVRSTKELSIEGAFGEVEARMSVASIEARGDKDAKAMTFRFTVFEKVEGDLAITTKSGEKADEVVFKTKSGDPYVISKVELVVPLKRSLVLHSANGEVKLADYATPGSLTLSSQNGAVTVDRVDASDTSVTCKNGAVTVTGAAGGTLTLKGSNGGLTVRGAKVKAISLTTENGGIEIAGSACDTLRGKTKNGNIRLVKTTCADRKFDTVNGSVEEE